MNKDRSARIMIAFEHREQFAGRRGRGRGGGIPRGLIPVPEFDENRLQHQFHAAPELTARADRRNTRSKMLAGIRGLKHAIRGDSSFFAHGYRGTLIAITAALLGVNQWGWCLLVIAACLVLIAELAHSAVDTLARAIGDPDEPRLRWPARSPPPASSSPPSAPAASP